MKKILEGTEEKTIFFGMCGNELVFSGELFNFFTKLLVDSFPQYQTILDKQGFLPARVDRSHFIKTLRRSSCMLSGQFIATTFGFGPEKVKVDMHNKEVGKLQEEVPLEEFTGDEFEVRFYAPYLLSGLQLFSDEQITFYLQSQSKPIMFESQGKNEENTYHLLYLVMPVAQTNG